MLVAVYGTLKNGYGNNRLLRDCQFVVGVTVKKYDMRNTGYPVIFPDAGGHAVWVEVYSVANDTLRNLDRLEGHPAWYERKLIRVDTPQGTVEAQIYEGTHWNHRPEAKVLPDEHGVLVWGR